MFRSVVFMSVFMFAMPAWAGDLQPREGWAVYPTSQTYEALIKAVKTAVKSNGLIVVTQAGPTKAAANRGITIPGNRVIGVFNNDFAVRVLETSTAAMIEAPIRMYVTENEGGTATLSYKLPSHVMAPYSDEGGAALAAIAQELDARFLAIADDATKGSH
ncbi:hypothetical protein TRL7639_03016 [Falsiruegeria litorea R37]|uniref:DUF302 domain-containing protein n=1 Tax=Falsiruegeria litorea R37 TaxID=1200284 RepID=A0A1Y5TB08_9RHOB|nr:DUF302 domain-containing protein [Falsiruegeria litorea]SLN56336.1 hypothetical protein TRL7639_03016 [Falsiruegeria litorea R37]